MGAMKLALVLWCAAVATTCGLPQAHDHVLELSPGDGAVILGEDDSFTSLPALVEVGESPMRQSCHKQCKAKGKLCQGIYITADGKSCNLIMRKVESQQPAAKKGAAAAKSVKVVGNSSPANKELIRKEMKKMVRKSALKKKANTGKAKGKAKKAKKKLAGKRKGKKAKKKLAGKRKGKKAKKKPAGKRTGKRRKKLTKKKGNSKKAQRKKMKKMKGKAKKAKGKKGKKGNKGKKKARTKARKNA